MKVKLYSILFSLILIFSLFGLTSCTDDSKSGYKISFMINNDIYSAVETKGSESITLPNNPIKDGFKFIGWYFDNESFDKPFVSDSLLNTELSSDINLYAKMLEIYNITYELNGGENSENNPKEYTAEDDITFESATKADHTFLGWYLDDSYTKQITRIEPGKQNKDITLYANYSINQYEITFNSNGGTEIESITQSYGTDVVEPDNPTKEGFRFIGWFTDKSLKEEYTFTTMPNKNITVYAKWEEIPYLRVDIDGKESDTGDYILFGSYPQTDVTESAGALGLDAGTLPTSENDNGWVSYEYYAESSNDTSFMWYKDVEKNSNKYRAVYFTSYRPRYPYLKAGANYSSQDENWYFVSTVYWFKFENIKWRIIEETHNTALLLCEMSIDSQGYQNEPEMKKSDYYIKDTDIYANNYQESMIRTWLNNDFYNTAFRKMQKDVIVLTTVDNSADSTRSGSNKFACNDTEDKVYLLSYKEANRTDYGFEDSWDETITRAKYATDYAKAQGAYIAPYSAYKGYCRWMLRSPIDFEKADSIHFINSDGGCSNVPVEDVSVGIVPVLRIMLPYIITLNNDK